MTDGRESRSMRIGIIYPSAAKIRGFDVDRKQDIHHRATESTERVAWICRVFLLGVLCGFVVNSSFFRTARHRFHRGSGMPAGIPMTLASPVMARLDRVITQFIVLPLMARSSRAMTGGAVVCQSFGQLVLPGTFGSEISESLRTLR